jgi:hypothetical protein
MTDGGIPIQQLFEALQAPKVVQPQDDAPRRDVPVVPPALRIHLPKAA